MGKIEKAGTGVQRMQGKMKEANLPEPIFDTGNFFIATLRRPTDLEKDLEKLTDNQKKIIQEIGKKNTVTQEELSKIIGITEKNIRNNIAILKKRGLLKRIGPDKGGRWEVST